MRRRVRRRNPGTSTIGAIGLALLAGVGAGIASAWIADGPLATASNAVQNAAVVAEMAGAWYWIDNPLYLGAVVVGIGLVQASHIVYAVAPSLATPPRMGAGAPSTMTSLHMGNVRRLLGMDKEMSALHRGTGMGALHNANLRALHRGGGIAALHQGTIAALQPARTLPARRGA